MKKIEEKEHIEAKEKMLKEIEKSFEYFLEDEKVVINESGRKVISGSFNCIPADDEIVALLSENVIFKYGFSPENTEDYEMSQENGEYMRALYISRTAFELGRKYAELLEKNYKSDSEKEIVYVTWDPHDEKVVCVHKTDESTCEACEKIIKESPFGIRTDKFEIKK